MASEQPHFDGALGATEAHHQAMGIPLSLVVEQLVDILGATDAATIGGVKETRAVAQWLSGERLPQQPHRLRFALQLATMIGSATHKGLVRAWFHGSNPELDDATPVVMLRDRPLEEIQTALMLAARSFAARTRTEKAL